MVSNSLTRKTVTDLENIFSAPAPKVVGTPNTELVLADDAQYALTAAITRSNQSGRLTPDGKPMSLHTVFSMGDDADGYGIPSDDCAGEDFDFTDFLNTY